MSQVDIIGEVDLDLLRRVASVLKKNQGKPVNFSLATHGGCFYSALGIHDLIRSHKHEITITCVGPVFSAGMIILAAADKRRAYPKTHFLVHYGTSVIGSGGEKRQEDKAFKMFKDILDDSSKVQRRVVANWLNQETYMSAERALSAGLIDEIIKI